MTTAAHAALDALLDAAVPRDPALPAPAGTVPSASVVILHRGQPVYARAAGWARLGEAPRAATVDTVYDLASVTKALGAAAVAAALHARGALDLDAPVAEVLPDAHPALTAWHLLSHTGGFPAWLPLYELATGKGGPAFGSDDARRAIVAAARRAPPTAPPGAAHVYSDLGFLALLELLEAVGGDRLDALHRRHVLDAAGLQGALTWGHPDAAATERCPVRGRLVQGEVHDLNAAAMGGVSSHAGLFGTARAVAAVADALRIAAADGAPGLPGASLRALWTRRGAGSHRGGWDGVSAGYTSTGAHFPPDTVGHLGYTGTSVWIAPSRDATVVLLTNRVHPDDGGKDVIRALRPRVHDAAAAILGWAPC